jgi:hypothetical protein
MPDSGIWWAPLRVHPAPGHPTSAPQNRAARRGRTQPDRRPRPAQVTAGLRYYATRRR